MHDLMFTKDIINALDEELGKLKKGSAIIAVNAALSPLSHVKPEGLIETFRAAVKGTKFEKVLLNVKVLQLGIICRACKQGFLIDKPTIKCPACMSADLDIVYSKEFAIESIETGDSI